MIEHSDFWFILVLGIAVFFISLAILFGLQIAYSQDIDPNAYCLYKHMYPFNELCYDQQQQDMFNKMLEKAQEWNENFN